MMLAGTAAAVRLLARVTRMPPAGAGPLRVTVPVEGLPPVTVAGLSDTAERATAGFTARRAVLWTAP